MKKSLFSLLGALALVAAPAFADDAAPSTYTCSIRGDISGVKLGFFVDGQLLGGEAIIHCVGDTNSGLADVSLPVKVSVLGGGVGFDFTIVERTNIVSEGIGAVKDPASLLGEYDVGASAGVTLINRGINVQSAISLKRRGNGAAFELGFQGEKAVGLGGRLDGMALTVERK